MQGRVLPMLLESRSQPPNRGILATPISIEDEISFGDNSTAPKWPRPSPATAGLPSLNSNSGPLNSLPLQAARLATQQYFGNETDAPMSQYKPAVDLGLFNADRSSGVPYASTNNALSLASSPFLHQTGGLPFHIPPPSGAMGTQDAFSSFQPVSTASALSADPLAASQIQQVAQVAFMAGQMARLSKDGTGHLNPFLECRATVTNLEGMPPMTKEDKRKLEENLRKIKDRMARSSCAQCEKICPPPKPPSKEPLSDKGKRQSSSSKPKPGEVQLCHRCRLGGKNVSCFHCGMDALLFPLAKKAHDILGRSVCLHCLQDLVRYGPPIANCSDCHLPSVWRTQDRTPQNEFSPLLCRRCANYRKCYGAPEPCDECQKLCAFNKGEDWLSHKVDNRLLCHTCTIKHKRKKHQLNTFVSSKKTYQCNAKFPPPGFAVQHLNEGLSGNYSNESVSAVDQVLCPYELLQREDRIEKHRDAKYWRDRWRKLLVQNGLVSTALENLKKELKSLESESRSQQDSGVTTLTQIIEEQQKTSAEKRKKLSLELRKLTIEKEAKSDIDQECTNQELNAELRSLQDRIVGLTKVQGKVSEEIKGLEKKNAALRKQNAEKRSQVQQNEKDKDRMTKKVKLLEGMTD